ncbi:MAG: Gldg family protein [Rikenellaceae bacterium]|nr:Gldg family protein [Rikenellaceae bacterium]MCL2693129.1 Gldg family protein [Rikenellaceae bacterium]
MKMIFNIARAELQQLFYSPVAWLLLVIFTLQCALSVSGTFDGWMRFVDLGGRLSNLSMGQFGAPAGLFTKLLSYLYFYIPLLTMGLVSRELSSGSIKLLYSSPITSFHIIVGKYASMMAYGAIMMGILLVFVLTGLFTIHDFELGAVLTGMLGLYLLLCAYAAIGIFMSSLTHYQIIAAIGTLLIFMGLSVAGRYGQSIDFIRDVTWWLSMNGRVNEFINGLITSEDVLYFIIIIALFLTLTIVRLNAVRQKARFTITLGKNIGVIVVACLLGYFSARPALMSYYDATRTKRNTLTQASQDIIAKLDGKVTITTYINAIGNELSRVDPRFLNPDRDRYKQYIRFKPDLKLKYVRYYDGEVDNPQLDQRYPDLNPRQRMVRMMQMLKIDTMLIKRPEEVGPILDDLRKEGNHFVSQIVRENGQKGWLRIFNDNARFPGEREISAVFKRMVMELPVVGFFQGHNSRSYTGVGDRAYGLFANTRSFRSALMNQGFDIAEVRLNGPVPENINIMVIADLFEYFTPEEEAYLQQYIDRGDNLFILGEPRRREVMQPLFNKFGFEMVPGILVHGDPDRQADLIPSYPTVEAGEKIAHQFTYMRVNQRGVLGTPSVGGLEQIADLGYDVTTMFRTAPEVWNELEVRFFTDDEENQVKYNPDAGEVMKSYNTVVALSRKVGDKEQKIILSGDADCISNTMGDSRIRNSVNYTMITGGFFWFSDYEAPVDVRRPPLTDNKLYIGKKGVANLKIVFKYVMPGILLVLATFIWFRRRGR